MSDLKLIALDQEDLAVISAHLQDAVVKVEDLAYLRREKRFAAIVNRFDWAATMNDAVNKRPTAKFQRRRAGLRFERVMSARVQGLDLKAKARVLSLLAIQFEQGISPGGTVTILFSDHAAIQLDVECIEAEIKDLGAVWRAKGRPEHPEGDGSKTD